MEMPCGKRDAWPASRCCSRPAKVPDLWVKRPFRTPSQVEPLDPSSISCHLTAAPEETQAGTTQLSPIKPAELWEIINSRFKPLGFRVVYYTGVDNQKISQTYQELILPAVFFSLIQLTNIGEKQVRVQYWALWDFTFKQHLKSVALGQAPRQALPHILCYLNY